jgi:hypothetical protein
MVLLSVRTPARWNAKRRIVEEGAMFLRLTRQDGKQFLVNINEVAAIEPSVTKKDGDARTVLVFQGGIANLVVMEDVSSIENRIAVMQGFSTT